MFLSFIISTSSIHSPTASPPTHLQTKTPCPPLQHTIAQTREQKHARTHEHAHKHIHIHTCTPYSPDVHNEGGGRVTKPRQIKSARPSVHVRTRNRPGVKRNAPAHCSSVLQNSGCKKTPRSSRSPLDMSNEIQLCICLNITAQQSSVTTTVCHTVVQSKYTRTLAHKPIYTHNYSAQPTHPPVKVTKPRPFHGLLCLPCLPCSHFSPETRTPLS